MRISDWSSDVCSSDLPGQSHRLVELGAQRLRRHIDGALHDLLVHLGPVAELVGGIDLNFDPPPGRFLHLLHKAVDVFEMVGTRFGHRGQAQDRLRGGGGAKSERQHARKSKNRSEEHMSELQSLMRISYAVF